MQENEADSILLQEELYPDSIFKFKPIPTKEEQEQPSETTSFVLQPIPRDIPTGEAVSPTSLSLQTENDYYMPDRFYQLPHHHKFQPQ